MPKRMSRRAAALALSASVIAGALALPPAAAADATRDGQWYLSELRVAEAHKITKGEGVTIGVIDTGVDATHPDLTGSVLPGADLGGTGGKGLAPSDTHGTGVASVLVGHDDPDGVLGIAPGAKVISVRATDANGELSAPMIAEAIRWLVDNGADVITASLGGNAGDAEGQAAVDYATAHEVPVIAAAGNKKGERPYETWYTTMYPAAFTGAVAVTGTTTGAAFWDGSVQHVVQAGYLGISAPAAPMTVAKAGGGYREAAGTSYSAPIVAGTLALIKSRFPNLNRRQMLERLLLTADDKGAPGPDVEYGYGVVDPLRALTEDVAYATPPVDTLSSGPAAAASDTGSGTSGLVPVAVTAGGLLLVAVVVILVVRSARRRRPATSAVTPPAPPQGPPPPPGDDAQWRRP
ncbi:type VII secretion-associated serine protease [Actinorhabdospora filicis]|uniref:Type VII secretion-associated serine protease n=1 Tax=Actinorhabdospora filicis TaxID=1785913 RepID=A0A9W6STL7_9ACTN|nr:S8 family serine peptidase [Actinorhabdospora filicis]GLZ81838.1 type VII secretion-associated serine protease [Actinorhabdospora filicis]